MPKRPLYPTAAVIAGELVGFSRRGVRAVQDDDAQEQLDEALLATSRFIGTLGGSVFHSPANWGQLRFEGQGEWLEPGEEEWGEGGMVAAVRGRGEGKARAARIAARLEAMPGTGFVMAIAPAHNSLRALLFLRACLRGRGLQPPPDVRAGLGLGAFHTELGGRVAMDSEAALRALQMLHGLVTNRTLGVLTGIDGLDAAMQPISLMLDELIRHQSPQAAQALCGYLEGLSQGQLAARLQISQSAVSQRLQTAAAPALECVCEFFERSLVR